MNELLSKGGTPRTHTHIRMYTLSTLRTAQNTYLTKSSQEKFLSSKRR